MLQHNLTHTYLCQDFAAYGVVPANGNIFMYSGSFDVYNLKIPLKTFWFIMEQNHRGHVLRT